MNGSKRLAKKITAPADSNVRMHWGRVTSITPLTVQIGEDPNSVIADIKQLLTYVTLAVNDKVIVCWIGKDPIVLGKLA